MTTIPIPIQIGSEASASSASSTIAGIPFAESVSFDLGTKVLLTEEGKYVHVTPTSYWPSGYVRWAVCRFLYPGKNDITLQLADNTNTTDDDFDSNGSNTYQEIAEEFQLLDLSWRFIDKIGSTYHLNFEVQSSFSSKQGDIECKSVVLGATLGANSNINFTWRIERSSLSGKQEHSFTIHNASRAMHPGGKWDLGDENSLIFGGLVLQVQTKNGQAQLENLENNQTLSGKLRLVQHSSGSENSTSANHVDRTNQVPFDVIGYEVQGESELKGDKFTPLIKLGESALNVIKVPDFWQNFPSAVSLDDNKVEIELFPKLEYSHELQPGEQKTHTIIFAGDQTELKDLVASPTPEYIESTNVVPFFASETEFDIQAIIDLGLDEHKGFDAKKELIDEYGWRNYGDLYADHENAEFKGDKLIVSHYNNQYDPIYGFLRQYLKAQNDRWLALAKPLAAHVKDIDIYRTDEDRAEYNNGLFWHTDHYVDAATASHRTYSINQPQDVYMDHAGGGGPGGQHCYTSGLALHFLMTGDVTSKEAVLKLTDWISNVYEGSGGVLDYILAYKNASHRIDLKNVKTGQYPLDRGTGNYLIALMDSYDVTGSQSYLDKASLVIKHTVDLGEDLAQRNFEDVEETWFYTVFLQAVCRYVWLKSSLNQPDESNDYAIQLILKFADWMADNERPYLIKPEILEFPNETWTAQDLRKVNVLTYASLLSKEHSERYVNKAQEIRDYLVEQLSDYENSHYCRILCLLMQNEGMTVYCKKQEELCGLSSNLESLINRAAVSPTKEVLIRLKNSSIRNELNWLAKRSQKVADIQSKIFK